MDAEWTKERLLLYIEEETKRHNVAWKLSRGEVRTTAKSMCPLQWFTGRFNGYLNAAVDLGIDRKQTRLIVAAADNRDPLAVEVNEYRSQLLSACGLS